MYLEIVDFLKENEKMYLHCRTLIVIRTFALGTEMYIPYLSTVRNSLSDEVNHI